MIIIISNKFSANGSSDSENSNGSNISSSYTDSNISSNSSENITNSNTENSNTENSSLISSGGATSAAVDSRPNESSKSESTTNYPTDISSSSSTESTSSDVIPDYIRPEIDETMAEIEYAGINNLTPAQNTPATKIRLAQLVSDATLGKAVDYAEILDTSTETRVLIDVHFKNGETVNYSALFDTLYSFNFMRCLETEEYEFILNGGNL